MNVLKICRSAGINNKMLNLKLFSLLVSRKFVVPSCWDAVLMWQLGWLSKCCSAWGGFLCVLVFLASFSSTYYCFLIRCGYWQLSWDASVLSLLHYSLKESFSCSFTSFWSPGKFPEGLIQCLIPVYFFHHWNLKHLNSHRLFTKLRRSLNKSCIKSPTQKSAFLAACHWWLCWIRFILLLCCFVKVTAH